MNLNESIKKATELRSQGLTLQRIGDQLGLSRQRIHQIIHEAKKREKEVNEWCYGLSVRNTHIVNRLKIKSKEEAIKAIQSQEIRPYRWANFGLRSYHDLCSWLGIAPIVSKYSRKAPKLCPHCNKEINQ